MVREGYGDSITWGSVFHPNDPRFDESRSEAIKERAAQYELDVTRINALLGDVACNAKIKPAYLAALADLMAGDSPLAKLIRAQAMKQAETDIDEEQDEAF